MIHTYKNIIFLILFTLFIGCRPSYQLSNKESRIIIMDNKYYENDYLNISIELPINDYDYFIPQKIEKNISSILSQSKMAEKDSILYFDRESIIVLKDKIEDLPTFRKYSIPDSTINKFYDSDNTDSFFYRKTKLNKKKKEIIVQDVIPYNKKFIAIIYYLQSELMGGSAAVDPTDPDDIVFISGWYKNLLDLSKKNAENIYKNKRTNKENPFSLFSNYFKQGKFNNYRAAFRGAESCPNYYEPQNKGMFGQALATYYSFAQESSKADSTWKELIISETGKPDNNTFLPFCLDSLINNQVVMFNEAHHVPKHRYLVGVLLDDLYNEGFRYLALEAFANDSLLSNLGFPTSENGFYIQEPVFSNLIRKAYNIGYTIFGYDHFGENREKEQANNIYEKTIKNNPEAKVIVLAGYSHIRTDKMAGEFYNISGIKPLTIDQTYYYNQSLKFPFDSGENINIIQNDSLKKSLDVDIILSNNLIIENNCFQKSNIKPLFISIPSKILQEAKIVCIYKMTELNQLNEKNENIKPIPVKVLNIDNNENFNIQLCDGEYTIVYLDNYGNILLNENLIINN